MRRRTIVPALDENGDAAGQKQSRGGRNCKHRASDQ